MQRQAGGGHDFGAMYTFNPITALTPNFNLDVKVGFTVMNYVLD